MFATNNDTLYICTPTNNFHTQCSFNIGMAILVPDQNQEKEFNTNPEIWHMRIENSRKILKDPDLTEKTNREKEGLGCLTNRFKWYALTLTETAYKSSCNLS